jgi:hypothetical protein
MRSHSYVACTRPVFSFTNKREGKVRGPLATVHMSGSQQVEIMMIQNIF